MKIVRVGLLVAVAGLGCKGGSSEDRIAERQKALEEARAAQKKAAEAEGGGEQKAPDRPKDPFWDDPGLVLIRDEKQCPDELWALFPGPAPGGDDQTRKQNEARRPELAKALREKTFVTRLNGPPDVALKEYDAPKALFPLELKGLVDCEDSIGRIAFALNEGAKPITPPHSAATSDAITQSYWVAPPRTFTLPMKSTTDARNFRNKHQFGLEAYIVFKIARTDVHKKLVKVPKVTQGEVTIGGTTDDFGAGRAVFGKVEGVRVLANPGAQVVIDTRDPSKVSLK